MSAATVAIGRMLLPFVGCQLPQSPLVGCCSHVGCQLPQSSLVGCWLPQWPSVGCCSHVRCQLPIEQQCQRAGTLGTWLAPMLSAVQQPKTGPVWVATAPGQHNQIRIGAAETLLSCMITVVKVCRYGQYPRPCATIAETSIEKRGGGRAVMPWQS